jgi:serine/threonine-protein kinase
MVARSPGCNPNRLRLLLNDSLSNEQQAEVVEHLDECTECQKALETLAADSIWWERLRQVVADEPTRSVHRAGSKDNHAGGEADARGDGISLEFLDKPDDPTHLGRLGSFAVTEVLGQGGFGVVLKAFDVSLNRPVAIKVLAPHLAASGAARKRFAREAQAAAAVVHEHVVPIHGVDTWKGLSYLVMSFVPGRSLQQRLDSEGPLDLKEILRIGMQTALGLAAAHAQGLVHRDIKPANILLEHGVQRVRITDFGLARAIDDASLTQSGVIAGTPPYMSPEQARGEAVDHRSDLFSLGSTLYATCAGHAPFRANSAMAVLLRIRDEQPRPIREVNPDIPVWLAGIIEKLHAKAPEHRFQSAAEVADLLGNCLAHVQQPRTNPLPQQLARQFTSRRPSWRSRWVIGISTLLALGLLSLATWSWKPLVDRIGWAQDATEKSDRNPRGDEPLSTEFRNEPGLEGQVDEVSRQSRELESEFRKPLPPSKSNDSALPWLIEAQQRLEKLERELSPSTPNK